MKLKVLALLSGVLVVLAAAAFAVNRWMNAPEDIGRMGQTLMSGVDTAAARRIEVISPEHKVTLDTADGSVWAVAQQHEFPVDTKKIKSLLVKLTTVKLAHKVTDNPDKLGELGLLTEQENGGKLEKDKTGRLVTISGPGDKPLFRLILGNDRQGGGAMAFGGTYVRYPDEKTAYLISDSVVVDLRPQDWIDTVVLDLDADKAIQSVRMTQPGQRTVQLTREKAGDPFALAGLPSDQVDQDSVRRVTGQLAGLSVFGVKAGNADPAEVGRKHVGQVEFTLFDKRRFTMDVGTEKAKDDYRYLTIRAALDAAVKDDALHAAVEAFNKRFEHRLLAVYDWDGGRMLQGWDEYKKKPAKKS
jgi:hypothetical protein